MAEGVFTEHEHWDIIIGDENTHSRFEIRSVWHYRDLLAMFIKRDIITVYKQTVLGPLWFLIQPILTTLTYLVIFGVFAQLGTDSTPKILFYLIGVTLWNYFSETLSLTSRTFADNATIFGKVYFPRAVIPLSKVFSGLIKFFIQFGLFFIIWLFFFFRGHNVSANWTIILGPVLIVIIAMLSLGFGLFITTMTAKYRDIAFLVAFGLQLFMYATPVIYPLSKFGKYKTYILLNPLTSIFEAFKYAWLGKGYFNVFWLMYSAGFGLFILVAGLFVFTRAERKFIDTV